MDVITDMVITDVVITDTRTDDVDVADDRMVIADSLVQQAKMVSMLNRMVITGAAMCQ